MTYLTADFVVVFGKAQVIVEMLSGNVFAEFLHWDWLLHFSARNDLRLANRRSLMTRTT